MKAPTTRERVEASTTLEQVEAMTGHRRFKVTRNSDGAFIGYVERRHHVPHVNYKGTRIRRVLKGGPRWFVEYPDRLQVTFWPSKASFHRFPYRTRWEALAFLLECADDGRLPDLRT